MLKRLTSVVLCSALLIGCSVSRKPPSQLPNMQSTQLSTESPKGLPIDLARHRVKLLIHELASFRGWSPKQQFQVQVVDQKEMMKVVQRVVLQATPTEQLDLQLRVLCRLGIFPVSKERSKVLFDFYAKEAVGLYDQSTDTMFVNKHISLALLDDVLRHELMHGLQDSLFNLDDLLYSSFQDPLKGRQDAQMARSFLIEGDAQATMLGMAHPVKNISQVDRADLRRQMIAALGLTQQDVDYPIMLRIFSLPYTEGARTVARLAAEHGWHAVDDLYNNPPETTEQMLHYEKLIHREVPIAIRVETAPILKALPNEVFVREDELGEAYLLAMLADHGNVAEAQQQAAGWNGDKMLVLDRKGRDLPLVMGKIIWDSIEDAKQFERGFQQYLQRFDDHFLLTRRGQEVVYAVGTSQQTLVPLLFQHFVTSPLDIPLK